MNAEAMEADRKDETAKEPSSHHSDSWLVDIETPLYSFVKLNGSHLGTYFMSSKDNIFSRLFQPHVFLLQAI